VWWNRNSQQQFAVIPAKLAVASASRNPGNTKENWITAFAVMTKGPPLTYSANFNSRTLEVISQTPNELPRSKLTGYQRTLMRSYPKGVTPERFYRGSSPSFVWIPDRSIRE